MQLKYLDVMEELIGKVVQSGDSFEKAMRMTLPDPFDKWLKGGMGIFGSNVRYLFWHLGGVLPEEA